MRIKKCVLIISILLIILSLAGCSDSKHVDNTQIVNEYISGSRTIDFLDAETLELALNSGVNVNGKIASISTKEVEPKSAFGFNIIAGEHLNFVSEDMKDVNAKDKVILVVDSVKKKLGSWIIEYSLVDIIPYEEPAVAVLDGDESDMLEITDSIEQASSVPANDDTEPMEVSIQEEKNIEETSQPTKDDAISVQNGEETKGNGDSKPVETVQEEPNEEIIEKNSDTENAPVQNTVVANNTSTGETSTNPFQDQNLDPPAEDTKYVLNKSSKVFHFPTCRHVKKITENNREDVTDTRDSIITNGYKSCGTCNP